jgi:NSS family neurotransmitter:Na+ symporter
LKNVTIHHKSILDVFDFVCTAILIPLGALFAVILAGWYWGIKNLLQELRIGGYAATSTCYKRFEAYLQVCIRYVAPITILIVAGSVLFG